MKKFRLPRNIKKKMKNGFYLYPADENGNSVMGFPKENQDDYDAYKKGVLKDRFKKTKAQEKKHSEEWVLKFELPIEVSDDELSMMVDEVFAEEFRKRALSMLLSAKKHDVAIKDYYIFINAYKLNEFNICAMCYDGLELDLKRKLK